MRKGTCWVVLLISAGGIIASILGYLSSDYLANQYGYVLMMVSLAFESAHICIPGKFDALLHSWPLSVRLALTLPIIIFVIMDLKAGPLNIWAVGTAALGIITALGFILPSLRSE